MPNTKYEYEDNHPLIELLRLTDCLLLASQHSFGAFQDLKAALMSDGAVPITPRIDIAAELDCDIRSSDDFWSNESKIIAMIIKNYSNSVLEDLISTLKDYCVNESELSVDVKDACKNSSHVFLDGIDEWAAGFDGDKKGLSKIYGQWKNTIDYIDRDEVIKGILEVGKAST